MNIEDTFALISFENNTEYFTLSKALVMSIRQENTSDPFLKKYPTVSTAPQVHIEGEQGRISEEVKADQREQLVRF